MVRDITRDDLPLLAQLYHLFWGEESNLEKMYGLFEKLENDPSYIILGCFNEHNELTGSVMGIVCRELYGECEPFMVLENMVVDSSRQRGGVGTNLIMELEKRAVKAGCRQMILVTEKIRKDACSFYEAKGFSNDHTGYKKKLNAVGQSGL